MSANRAIYVIGGGPLGLRTLETARAAGLHVVVTDRNRAAPGLALADEHFLLDGTDVEGHLAAAKSVRVPIAGVLCGAEFAARTVQRLREALGLEHDEAAATECALDKRAMKQAFREAAIPTPVSIEVGDAAELRARVAAGSGAWVIKPAGGSGSRGVKLVDAQSDLNAVFAESLAGVGGETTLLAEPYHAGRSIDANGLFLDGVFHRCGVLEKFPTPAPDFLPLGGGDPPDLAEAERDTVYDLLERACRAVGLCAGPVKGDLLRHPETGEYVVLEVASRFHGDVTTCSTLPFGSRIDPLRFWFHFLATGEKDESLLRPARAAHAVWRVLCLPPGRLLALADPEGIGAHTGITMLWHNPRLQRAVPRYDDTTKIPGYVCAWGEEPGEAAATIREWFATAGYRVAPDPAHAAWFARLRAHLEEAGLADAV